MTPWTIEMTVLQALTFPELWLPTKMAGAPIAIESVAAEVGAVAEAARKAARRRDRLAVAVDPLVQGLWSEKINSWMY